VESRGELGNKINGGFGIIRTMEKIVSQAKKYQLKIIQDFGDPYNLNIHLPEVERWVKKICKLFPKANKQNILLSVWLHDTGHYTGNQKIDHAIISEKNASRFLKNKIGHDQIAAVGRIIRCHRNKDVKPETLEEKIFVCADSASHFTGIDYIVALNEGRFEYIFGKLERDFRDIGLVPEIGKELKPLYSAYKKLFKEYRELGIVKARVVPYDRI